MNEGVALNCVILARAAGCLQSANTSANARIAVRRAISASFSTPTAIPHKLYEFVTFSRYAARDHFSGAAVHGEDIAHQFAHRIGAALVKHEDAGAGAAQSASEEPGLAQAKNLGQSG